MTSDEPELNDEPEDDVRATPSLDRGVWCVRSAGSTVYWVDLDRGRLLRVPGDGSSTGPYDGVWVPLVSVERLAIGERPRYLTDPDGAVRSEREVSQGRSGDGSDFGESLGDVGGPSDVVPPTDNGAIPSQR